MIVVVQVAMLEATNLTRAAAGTHDAERYFAVLMAPVALLALASWPAATPAYSPRAARRLSLAGKLLLVGWLAYSSVRVAHNAITLSKRKVIVWPKDVHTP
jgi:hypothetical protein